MADATTSEELGTRYEIHVQNEDGTSTGDVIVIYSNDNNDPTQVQELVTKALAELAKQNQEQAVIVSDNGDGTAVQTEVYGTQQSLLTSENMVTELQVQDEVIKVEIEQPPPHQPTAESVVTKVTEEQVLKVEIEAPNSALSRQEVYTALKPEELEQMGMVTVENEFTAKATPYKLEAVEPEELMNIEEDLKIKKKMFGRRYHMMNTLSDTVSSETEGKETKDNETADENEDGKEVEKPEEKVVVFACCYDDCSFVDENQIVYQRHLKTDHGEVSPFKCSYCLKEFKLELSLHIHLLGHKEIPALCWESGKVKRQYSCFKCDSEFFYKRLLSAHLKEEHDITEVFTCQKCKFASETDEELSAHFESQSHEENQWVKCNLCGAASKNISQHMKRMHCDEKPFSCDICDYTCKFSGALKAHLLVHSSERAFKCEHCDYSARSKDQLKRHEVIHSTDKNEKCPLCNYATQTIYRLRKHMKIHTNSSGYRCILCEFTTHDKILLKKHKADVHAKKLNLTCKDCDATFSTVQELKVHALSVHKCSNNWFCKYCDFTCDSRRELGTHMQEHVGKHRYVCKICGYSCRQSNPFKRHLARHNKVKGFQCSMCSYSCNDKYDLEKHVITHSESKTVSCPDCSYTCRYKAQLVRHKKLVHDEAKPYFCTFCNYTTKSPQNLKNHMHLHAEKKPHQCVLCDFSACQKSNLKRHMQTHLKKAQIVYVQ